MTQAVYHGDCLHVLEDIEPESADLIYVDPPFFTQSVRRLQTRDGARTYEFSDLWKGERHYSNFLYERLSKAYGRLKPTGSLFFHCDRTAAHLVRLVLEEIFGSASFRSEIIWAFRRWSNAKRGLLNSHHTIYFFSKGPRYKFFPKFVEYSPMTNVDQLMQRRERDDRGKIVYARGADGEIVNNGAKKGVPLGDVWEIPFLNPKAKERTGYPTQKPVRLLRRIIELTTEVGDMVLDPFCGSGTTLVAARTLGRSAIGIDVSADAVNLTRERLGRPVESDSVLAIDGGRACKTHDPEAAMHLAGVDYSPVHRNKGIDGILRKDVGGRAVLLRVQRDGESRDQAADALVKASNGKGDCVLVVVTTGSGCPTGRNYPGVRFVNSTRLSLEECHG